MTGEDIIIVIDEGIDETIVIPGGEYYKGDPFLYSDFTPEQIAELKQPAIDAAAVAEQATTIATNAASAANQAAEAATAVSEGIVELQQSIDLVEAQRVTNEGDRQTAESAREISETARNEAEQLRDTAEQSRATAEGERSQAEQLRTTAEGERAAAELIRIENENARILSEQNRTNITEIAASAVAAIYPLELNKPICIIGALPNGANSTFTLPAPIRGKDNESRVAFNTNATAAPTLIYSGFTPRWLNGIAISMKVNKNYTLVFEQEFNGTAWVVKSSWGEY